MDVLPGEQEILIQRTVGEFLAQECTPAVVRAAEKDPSGYSKELWNKFASLGWLGLCLPEEQEGQGLPLTYLGLLLEEIGYHIAPLPVYSTLVPALVIAKYGSPTQREQLTRVPTGALILSFAVQEKAGHWSPDAVTMSGKIKGDKIILTGAKYFVDNFRNAEICLVAFRLHDDRTERANLATALVDTASNGIRCDHLVPTAKDSESVVWFENVHVPLINLVGKSEQGNAIVTDLMDYASVFLVSQMQGAARRAMEFAVEYAKQREAFGQPIGAFQAIQHMAADMINAVDGTQLLAREAIWRLNEGLPASVEVSQAKSFANEKCQMICRSAQQIHGGIGFMAEFDLNLWYRRVISWSLRAGTTYDHRQRIASALLDVPGNFRLGMTLKLPIAATTA